MNCVMKNMGAIIAATMLLLASGCELAGRKTADDGRTMMMNSDLVPLAPDERPYERGRPMPVPAEPSPFETGDGKPAAMLIDNETTRRAPKEDDSEPRRIPKEPIP